MQWFKNRKVMTKLMLGFGVVLAALAFVGYEGLVKLAAMDSQSDFAYEKVMAGISQVKEAQITYLKCARAVRNGVINAKNPAEVKKQAEIATAAIAANHTALTSAQAVFLTVQGQERLANVVAAMLDYDQAQKEIFRRLEANDEKAAREHLGVFLAIVARVDTNLDAAVKLKEDQAAQARKDADALYESTRNLLSIVIAVSFVFGMVLAVIIGRMIAVPLGQAVEVLNIIAAGDLTPTLDVHSKDEVGQMAAALELAIASIRDTLTEVRDSANNTASASEQLAAASDTLASGTQEQASSLEETAASLEQITATVRQNADNAKQANQLASGSRAAAEKGGQVVATAVTAMAEINSSSKKIADIISTIDEIAFQTNLLALNAAVEAARAGEQGRGFAVVASEVRNLAQRSSTAAKEIKLLIQDSVRKVENGSDLVTRSGETLQEIVASVKRVTDIVAEIAAASQEQTVGIEQVNKAMTQVDQVTQSNSAQTEELSSTAQSLSSQAVQLQGLVSKFVLDGQTGSQHKSVAIKQGRPAAKGSAKSSARPAVNGRKPRPIQIARSSAPVSSQGSGEQELVGAGVGSNHAGSSNGHDAQRTLSENSFEEF